MSSLPPSSNVDRSHANHQDTNLVWILYGESFGRLRLYRHLSTFLKWNGHATGPPGPVVTSRRVCDYRASTIRRTLADGSACVLQYMPMYANSKWKTYTPSRRPLRFLLLFCLPTESGCTVHAEAFARFANCGKNHASETLSALVGCCLHHPNQQSPRMHTTLQKARGRGRRIRYVLCSDSGYKADKPVWKDSS